MVMSFADRMAFQAVWAGNTPAAPLNEIKIANHLLNKLPGTFAFDEFSGNCRIMRDLPWNNRTAPYDVDDTVMRAILGGIQHSGVGQMWEKVSAHMVERAVVMACEANPHDELKDWFSALPRWDAVQDELEMCLIKQFGIEDNQRTRTLTRILFMQGISRALHPGLDCKADVMLVLQGEEGLFKSSFLKDLCPTPAMYGPDIPHPLGSKDSKDYLLKKFIIELAEMHSYRKSEVEAQKQFMSISADTFRASYGHFTQTHLRRCIFVGTSNLQEIIAENGRRIGILACTKPCDINQIPIIKFGLWAEALVMYQRDYVSKHRPIVTRDEEVLFKAGNEQYVIRSGYDDDFETWKMVVGDKWFTLKQVWSFIAKGRDIVDLEREKKRLTDALRNAGFDCMMKTYKSESAKLLEASHLQWRKPPCTSARLWRIKDLGMLGSVDHILDVYEGENWLQDAINGETMRDKADRAGI